MNLKAFLLVSVGLLSAVLYGQNNLVKRGPRQKVNIDALDESTFSPGKINIKFKAGFDKQLQAGKKTTNGTFNFGIPAVDLLLRSIGMQQAEKIFLNIKGSNTTEARHQAWDFQRWYTIYLPKNTKIKAAIKKLEALSATIEVAEPSYIRTLFDGGDPIPLFTPTDSAYFRQWHYNHTAQEGVTTPAGVDADIDLPEAWDLETGKPGVIVALIDGGVDTSHPDLRQNLWIGSNGERFGYNWNAKSSVIQPGNHGTHVCGTIAAVNNNGIGVSGIAGGNGSVSSGVRIMNMQIFAGATSVYAGDEAVANAFVFSADRGAAIAQNSWGGGSPSVMITDAIDYFIMNGGGQVMNGGLVVFSAGNSANEVESFPTSYPPVICVASTNYSDQKSWYSVYGSWVDICAPGGETSVVSGGGLVNGGRKGILSTLPVSGTAGYGWMQGTSMACPHVSGVAALCVSKAAGRLTNNQLRDILLSTADDIYPLNPAYTGKLGAGRVNAFKAVQAAALAAGVMVDSARAFSVTQACGQATLSWTKNAAGNQVIIAAADTLLFGSPSGTLNVGDMLPGGGTVIYKGAATTATDFIKINQRRYYRIWSVSGTKYSFSLNKSVLYSTIVNPLMIENAADCSVKLSWTDVLQCSSDSVLLIASNAISSATPFGILKVGDSVARGKVIYKGRSNSFVYNATTDSSVYFEKWSFNASHLYTGSNSTGNIVSADKPNSISTISAIPASDVLVNVSWTSNTAETCFGNGTYLLAYSTTGVFGYPGGSYNLGDSIKDGGTVIYMGANTSYQHTVSKNQKAHCYRIFKVKDGSVYSFGKSVCSTTPCGNNTILPAFTDNFDGEQLSEPDVCYWQIEDSSTRTDALKVFSGTSSNPSVTPVQGTGMLRFNAYNIPMNKNIRMSSSLIKKGAENDLDIRFRWYQDSSNYTTSEFTGEGVTVQWSTDKQTWQTLEFYPRVPNRGVTGWSYKQITLPETAKAKDSVYISLLFTSKFGNNCYLDNFGIRYSTYKSTNAITTNAVCESTDSLSNWTNYYDSSGDRLLSIDKKNQFLGKAGQPNFIVSIGGSSAATQVMPAANYVTNPGGWITMGRFYSLKFLTEPIKNINVHFYYFTSDIDAIATGANSLISPARTNITSTDLYGWKINDKNNLYNGDPSKGHINVPAGAVYNATGFNQYYRTNEADTATWQYRYYNNNLHSMEYLVRQSGSGGLGIGSVSGKGALQIVNYTFIGNGNWSTTSNWQSNNKPPALLPANGRVIINPAGAGECILDVKQNIPAGAELIVNPGKKFTVKSNLLLSDK